MGVDGRLGGAKGDCRSLGNDVFAVVPKRVVVVRVVPTHIEVERAGFVFVCELGNVASVVASDRVHRLIPSCPVRPALC